MSDLKLTPEQEKKIKSLKRDYKITDAAVLTTTVIGAGAFGWGMGGLSNSVDTAIEEKAAEQKAELMDSKSQLSSEEFNKKFQKIERKAKIKKGLNFVFNRILIPFTGGAAIGWTTGTLMSHEKELKTKRIDAIINSNKPKPAASNPAPKKKGK